MAMQVQKVYLNCRTRDKNNMDSMVTLNGNYSFKGKLTKVTLDSLRIKYQPDADGKPVKLISPKDKISIFLSKDRIEINSVDSFSNAKISGSKANDEF